MTEQKYKHGNSGGIIMKYYSMLRIIFILLFFLLLPKDNFCQAGMLDTTFGQRGIVTTAFNISSDSHSNSSALQSDGKIVAAGYSANAKFLEFALARYNTNGALDNTFGTNGIVLAGQINDGNALSVAIQGDGKIVAAGYSHNTDDNDFAIMRCNQDGRLDSTFGPNGAVITKIGLGDEAIHSIAIQSDGKIVAAGSSFIVSNTEFAIVRYNPNGALDNTFGTNGIVTTPVGTSGAGASSVSIQSDGKIVAAGSSENGGISDFTLVRYNSNGTLDNTFGTNGIVNAPIGVLNAAANSISIQSDGKIVAAGYTVNNLISEFALVRYDSNGALDNTFGINGIIVTPIGSLEALINSVSIQEDGKIVAAGYSRNMDDGQIAEFAIARYNSNGALDNTFGANGILTSQIGTMNAVVASVLIQGDGKIVATGQSGNGGIFEFTLVRYISDGTYDNTFGTDGIVTTQVGKSDTEAKSVSIQGDGKIVAAGYSLNENQINDFALARYNQDGTLDNTFGINGIVTTPVGTFNAVANSVSVQSDGRIIAAGSSVKNSQIVFTLVRYKPNGFADNTFGTNGIVTTPVGTLDADANSVSVQSDGKIIVGGSSGENGVILARYNSSGTLDDTFGTNGIVTTNKPSLIIANSISIQNDGKIVSAGNLKHGNINGFAILRYNSNGTLDSTFGTSGVVTTAIGLRATANSVSIQADDKIVAAGTSFIESNNQPITLARYNTNGTLDTTFGKAGIVTTQVGTSSSLANSVLIQSDGKIVATGYSFNGIDYNFTLVRYNPEGTLDNTFGTSGILTTRVGSSNCIAYSAAVQSDRKIVACGSSIALNGEYNVFTLIRYTGDAATGVNDKDKTAIPSLFTLEQNYPNPFNPSTSISFSLPEKSFVSLKVYDILGREISALIDKDSNAGIYNIKFVTQNLASGIYIYSLYAKAYSSHNEFRASKKMILLK